MDATVYSNVKKDIKHYIKRNLPHNLINVCYKYQTYEWQCNGLKAATAEDSIRIVQKSCCKLREITEATIGVLKEWTYFMLGDALPMLK